MAEPGAAPARLPRKQPSGTPRVAVRPNYVGLPFDGLDAGRTNAGESPPDGVRPRKHGPGVRNRRSGAPIGARPAIRTLAPQGVNFKGAGRRSAPSRW